MPYLLDTNSLSNPLLRQAPQHDDWFVLREVYEEFATTNEREQQINRSGINVLQPKGKHFRYLSSVLTEHGDNLNLISLLSNEGKADVLMIAFALAEREMPDTLFPQLYTIVTKDEELIRIAELYGFTCLRDI